jgi:hypothetical protein
VACGHPDTCLSELKKIQEGSAMPLTTDVKVFMDKLICKIHILLLGILASRSSKVGRSSLNMSITDEGNPWPLTWLQLTKKAEP